jgi:hypothetical protein
MSLMMVLMKYLLDYKNRQLLSIHQKRSLKISINDLRTRSDFPSECGKKETHNGKKRSILLNQVKMPVFKNRHFYAHPKHFIVVALYCQKRKFKMTNRDVEN